MGRWLLLFSFEFEFELLFEFAGAPAAGWRCGAGRSEAAKEALPALVTGPLVCVCVFAVAAEVGPASASNRAR